MTSYIFYWLAISVYAASAIGYAGSVAFSRPRWSEAGAALALAGLLAHTASLAFRWSATGHGPYINTYEILSSDVWIAVAFFLVIRLKLRRLGALGAVVMPLALGSTEVKALPPSLRSGWLAVHVIFAKLTVASMIVAVALSFFYLRGERSAGGRSGIASRLPAPGILDDYAYRATAFGFITLTVMIIAGAIWANYSWGEYWSWDPTETWSLVVWFVYGLYLHGRITFRWKRDLSAWYLIVSFLFSVGAFFVIPYFVKSLHSQYMVG